MITNGRVDSGVRLGFIGLGYLGSRIAGRLLAAGYPLVVYNRDPVKSSELAMLGAEVAPDPAALARSVDVVLSCLADGFAVEAVYFKGKVLRSARPGARIIEMSTVSPDTSRRLHWAAREYGLST
jgi:3-hydroxyisobutyrate dehydrogenase